MKYDQTEELKESSHYVVFPVYGTAWPKTNTTTDTVLDYLIAQGDYDFEPSDGLIVTAKELRLHFPDITVLPVRATVRVTRPKEAMSPEEYKRHQEAKKIKAAQFAKAEREAKRYPRGMNDIEGL